MMRVPNSNVIDAGVACAELLGLAEVALGTNVASVRKRGDSDKAVVARTQHSGS